MIYTAIAEEKLIDQIVVSHVTLELVSCPATLWCGVLGFAPNCTDEPDIGALLQKYQNLMSVPKKETLNPEWSCAISMYYTKEGAFPRGMMFAQQVAVQEQDVRYDVYRMPQSLFIRVQSTPENIRSAFGKENCELYEWFGFIKDSLRQCGYILAENGAQEIEMYDWTNSVFYAYVPVEACP